MLDSIINAFTKGDLAGLNSKLLHSAYWSQHNATLYGSEKLNTVLSHWLSFAGKCTVVDHHTIEQGNHCIIHLTFEPINNKVTINYVFWLETNHLMIKSVKAIVDTVQLATASQHERKQVSASLPASDPLMISDYDQQDHLQNDIAWPSMLVGKHIEKAEILDAWWALWGQNQLSNIDKIYSENAIINLSGHKTHLNRDLLFEYVLSKTSKLTRTFAQLEDIAIDGQHVAIKWFLDGDEGSHKIRLPFISILKIESNHITNETTLCDVLAFNKSFPLSTLFE
ncbi:hypothetical protein GPUN_1889 [Glaciecola punicea ACAM 611]|jgi:hypothetical protein|uniref:SnoaL-like domain-containing protein n=1 Tax=Glaciecola punicea ACAM 611 TaxID=1121923 RepID=H5TCH8_9ALTE|nr:hypothetical protein [Glaciecola punicea]OFA31898.1 hypothetical protein BAE46_06530 [Glaciecola punicea]GAB56005.1 hypothetical protein GPUN_1889 [Glaciecola punicea ACAM 611]